MWRNHTLLVFPVIISSLVIYLLTVPRRCYFCGSYFVIYVSCLYCLFLAALWSPDGKELTSWLSCVLCLLVFCHFPIWSHGSGVVLDCIDSSSFTSSIISVGSDISNIDVCWLVLYNTKQYLLFRVSVNTVITFGRSKRRRK